MSHHRFFTSLRGLFAASLSIGRFGPYRRPRANAWRAYRPATLLFAVCFSAGVAAQDCAVGGNNRPADSTRHCVPDAEPASHPNADPASGTGLSIDLISGNKYVVQTDAVWPGGLTLRRHYNSLNRFVQSMGPSWRHSFETVLSITPIRPGKPGESKTWQVQIVQGDGRRIVFNQRHRTGQLGQLEFTAPNPQYGAVMVQPAVSPDRRYRWRWRDGSSLYFSTTGHLTATEMASGHRLVLRYSQPTPQDSARRLMQVSNRFGQSITFAYAAWHSRLNKVTLPDGSQINYLYNRQGVLRQVRRNAVRRWQFDYADDHQAALTRIRDGNNVVQGIYRYDDQGRASYSSATNAPDDPLAIRVNYRLPVSIRDIGESEVTDAQGRITRYRWRYAPRSQRRQLLSAVGPGCRVCPASNLFRRYDKSGRPVELLSASGQVQRRWRYDAAGRLKRIDALASGIKPGPALSSTWFYYVDDSFASQLARIERSSVAPGKRHRMTLHYNNLGQLVRVVEAGFAPDVSRLRLRKNESTQSGINQHVTRWLPIRRAVRYRYVSHGAAQGLMASIDGPLPGDGDTTHFSYDRKGLLVQRNTPGSRFVRFTYDDNARIASMVNQAGRRWQFESHEPGQTSITSQGVSVTQHRNSDGLLTSLMVSNRPMQRFEWFADRRLRRITNNRGQWLTRDELYVDHDAAQGATVRLTRHLSRQLSPQMVPQMVPQITRQDPGLTSPAVTKPHDAKMATVQSRLHHWHDDFGRKVATVDSEVGVIRRVFDLSGRVVARTVLSGTAHDPSSERSSTRLYQYDDAGKLTGVRDQDGPLLINKFERGQLLVQKQRHQEIQLTQEPDHQDYRWQLRYFDPVSGIRFGQALEFARRFDDRGRLSERVLPGGWSVVYRWTDGNRLTAVSLKSPTGQTRSLVSDLAWMPFTGGDRGLLNARLGNGLTRQVLLDKQLRVRTIRHGASLPDLHLSYNPAGKLVRQAIGGIKTRYQYNRTGQLVAWQQDGRPVQQLQRKAGPHGNRWVAGNNGRTRWSRDDIGRTYRYIYNLAGQRIGKLAVGAPDESRWYVYDEQRLFMETDGSGNPLVIYLYLDDKPFVMLRADKTGNLSPLWIHTDHRGLPLLVTDKDASVVWRGEFTPYGRALHIQQPPGVHESRKDGLMPLRLPGQYFDADTGLHDNYHRTYNPNTGRYLGPDPIGPRPGAYRYAYARFSPMDTTDPLGLYEIDVHYYMTYFLGRMAGMGHEDANVVAHATQGIDDNPNTRPTDPGYVFGQDPVTPFVNQERLRTYHFVMYDVVHIGLPGDGPGDGIILELTSRETADPQSWQLSNLRQSVISAANGCTRMQLLGEMLHAYEDTYAHRNYFNIPYSATNDYGLGTGHMIAGHSPDYTYNPNLMWRVNEDRTWQMEQDVYQRLLEHGNPENAISPDQFEAVVREFNSIRENHQTGFAEKLALLDRFMRENGIMVDTDVGLQHARFQAASDAEATVVYVDQDAVDARSRNLCGQNYSAVGTIAPSCQ